jgi:membrane protein YqaA with SNARE-associated domain
MRAVVEKLLAWGPLGIFLIAIADSAGVPNPAGVDWALLILAWQRPESAYLAAGLATLGSLIGGYVLYSLAQKGGEAYLRKYTSTGRGYKFREWFQRYGLVTIFVPALVPVVPFPMKVFVLCAGAFEVSVPAYLAVLAAGRLPRYFGIAYLGRSLGADAKGWLKAHLWHFLAFAIVLLVALFLLVRVMERLHQKRRTEA